MLRCPDTQQKEFVHRTCFGYFGRFPSSHSKTIFLADSKVCISCVKLMSRSIASLQE